MLLFNLYKKELRSLGVKTEEEFNNLPGIEQDRLIDLCAESIDEQQQ